MPKRVGASSAKQDKSNPPRVQTALWSMALTRIDESFSSIYSSVQQVEVACNLAYWQTQSYEARLAALEEIRREYHRWKYRAEPRFQRVYRIVKR